MGVLTGLHTLGTARRPSRAIYWGHGWTNDLVGSTTTAGAAAPHYNVAVASLTAFPALAVVWLVAGQATPLIEQFRTADRFGKMRLLSESVLGKRPDDDVRAILAAGMKDPDVSVRSSAVGTIGTILTLSSLPAVPPGQEWTARLRPVAESLTAQLNIAVDDPEPRVRLEAIRAVVLPAKYRNPRAPLPKASVLTLAERFKTDPGPLIRTFALQAVTSAYESEDPEVRRLAVQILLQGLDEPDPYMVQAAGLAAAQSRFPEALPLLVRQLKHPSHVARMGVAQGIAAYREAARRYLPELEAALAAETDDITRKTLQGTISVITR